MLTLRKSNERGHFNHGWLNTYHTFSFAEYSDPIHHQFRALRVINEDWVQPGEGFPTHSHRDMEIITYVLEGSLAHKDSMGNGSHILPGDVQRMSAGTGVTHSEYNFSKDEVTHLLQIWILPETKGIPPSYEQKCFSDEEKQNRLRLIASPDRREGSVLVHQNVNLYASILEPGHSIRYNFQPGRHTWIQVARGQIQLNNTIAKNGDGIAITDEDELLITGKEASEFLLFDLA